MNLKLNKRHVTLIILSILTILLIYFILPVSIPIIIAFLTALTLNPVVRLAQKHLKLNRKLSVIFVFFIFITIITLSIVLVITRAIGQVVDFVDSIPAHINQLNIIYVQWENNFREYAQNLPPEFIKQVSKSIEENIISLTSTIREKITIENIAQVFSKVPQYLISFVVYLIALFLFMLELPVIKNNFYNMLTEETSKKVQFMSNRLSNVLFGFFKAQFLVSLVIFAVSFIGLLIIAPHVALLMALVIWIIDLIPIIGSIIILGPWAVYMFLVGKTAMGIQLSILALILLAIRRIVEPKFMGDYIGLSPLITLIAMFIGLRIFGFLGLFIGPLIVITISSAKEAGIIRWNFKI